MGGGGKSQTTTQQVSIPPEVLARYNAVNARAEDVASRPFQQYGTTAEAFVAPLTQAQQQGIQQTQQYGQAAQPYFGAATDQLLTAQQQGQAGLGAAYPLMQQGIQTGQQLGGEAYTGYQNLPGAFLPSFAQAQQGIQQGLGAGQALLGGGLGYTLAGSQGVSPQQFSGAALQPYMSPFLGNVVQQTMAAQAQQNAQQRNALTGNAIRSGAFGGDRAGIAQANLAYQQNLANQQTLANLLQGGYGQALGAFQQQQGVNLAADQANRAALQQTGQSLAGLGQQAFGMGTGAAQQQAGLGQALAGIYGQQAQGLAGLGQQQFGQGLTAAQQQAALAQQGYGMGAGTAQALAGLGQGAQAAGLQGAQAMLGAGQIQQQTEQAGKQALYNQFLQQQGYPFQVAQFLANIAMGTGALSGSTTTTQQPSSFFSDRRVKENVRKIGETEDGLPIYKFRYKGDKTDQTHIGYMADDVEKKHPDAVGEYGGVKTVDYNKVNARESMGGAVHDGGLGRGAYAYGGADHVDPNDLQAIIRQQQQMYGPNMGGLYGGSAQQTPHGGKANVPTGGLHVGKLATAGAAPRQREGGLRGAMGSAQEAKQMVEGVVGKYNPQTGKHEGSIFDQMKSAGESLKGFVGGEAAAKGTNTAVANAAAATPSAEDLDKASKALGLYAHGGLVPRVGYKFGGEDVYKADQSYVPEEVLESEDKKPELMTAKGGTGGGGGGGKSGLGTAVGLAGTLANFIPGVGPAIGTGLKAASMFMANGGEVTRHGYQEGGDAEPPVYNLLRKKEGFREEPYWDVNALRGGYGTDTFTTPEGTVLPVTKETRFTKEDAERDLRRRVGDFQQGIQSKIGQETWGGLDPNTQAALTSVAYNYGSLPNSVAKAVQSGDKAAIAQAVNSLGSHNEGVNASRRAYEASLIDPTGNYGAVSGGLGGGQRQVAAGQTTAPAAGGEKGGIGNFLTSSRFLVPLGTGLLTMASSPSRYLGAAALQGLGAGLAAMNVPEKQEAEIANLRLQGAGQGIANIRNSVMPFGNSYAVINAKGEMIPIWEWMKTREATIGGPSGDQAAAAAAREYERQGGKPGVPPANFSMAGGKSGDVDIGAPKPEETLQQVLPGVQFGKTSIQFAKREPEYTMGMNPEVSKKISEGYALGTANGVETARKNDEQLSEMMINTANIIKQGGIGAAGSNFYDRANLIKIGNTYINRILGGNFDLGKADTYADVSEKIRRLSAAEIAQMGGQESVAFVKNIMDAIPNGEMTPDAQAQLSATLKVLSQKSKDREAHMQRYGQDSFGSYVMAGRAFDQENPQSKYLQQINLLKKAVLERPEALKMMTTGQADPATVEDFFKRLAKDKNLPYTPGMSRMFMGQ